MDLFSAIADPVRRDILALLAARPAAAGVVADAFDGISRPAISRHLRVLREAGLVHAETHGRRQIYTATAAPLGEITVWVEALTPRFGAHLDALETEIYRTRRERTTRQSHSNPVDTGEERTA